MRPKLSYTYLFPYTSSFSRIHFLSQSAAQPKVRASLPAHFPRNRQAGSPGRSQAKNECGKKNWFTEIDICSSRDVTVMTKQNEISHIAVTCKNLGMDYLIKSGMVYYIQLRFAMRELGYLMLLNKLSTCRWYDVPWCSCDVALMVMLRNRALRTTNWHMQDNLIRLGIIKYKWWRFK